MTLKVLFVQEIWDSLLCLAVDPAMGMFLGRDMLIACNCFIFPLCLLDFYISLSPVRSLSFLSTSSFLQIYCIFLKNFVLLAAAQHRSCSSVWAGDESRSEMLCQISWIALLYTFVEHRQKMAAIFNESSRCDERQDNYKFHWTLVCLDF